MPDYERNEIFAQRLRVAMVVAGLRQNQAAYQFGVARGSLVRWLSGECLPYRKHLLAISDATGASVDWLMWPEPVDVVTIPPTPDPRLTHALVSETADG